VKTQSGFLSSLKSFIAGMMVYILAQKESMLLHALNCIGTKEQNTFITTLLEVLAF
jgi:hypothetical protein